MPLTVLGDQDVSRILHSFDRDDILELWVGSDQMTIVIILRLRSDNNHWQTPCIGTLPATMQMTAALTFSLSAHT